MIEVLVTSSVLILVLAALRRALRGRLSLRVQYALWLLVAVRLLIPVSLFSSPFSVMHAVEPVADTLRADWTQQRQPTAPSVPPRSTAYPASEGDPAPSTLNPAEPGAAQELLPSQGAIPSQESQAPGPVNWATVALLVWLAGAVTMGLWFLGSNLYFHRRLRRGARPLEGVGCPLPVYVSPGAPSPCLTGLVRGRIYLTPDCPTEGPALEHILVHELTHRRHGDPVWALVRGVCLALYWFDPLVWLAAALSRQDCELACDEGALKRLGEGERTAYGRTLLSLVTVRPGPGDLLRTATTMSSGARGLRERITLIARGPRRAVGALVLTLIVAAIVVGCTFSGAGDTPTPGPAESSPPPTEPTETNAVWLAAQRAAEQTLEGYAWPRESVQRTIQGQEVEFVLYHGNGWTIYVPASWEETSAGTWEAPSQATSFSVSKQFLGIDNVRWYRAQLGSWEHETEYAPPFDYYYDDDGGYTPPTGAADYVYFFAPDGENRTYEFTLHTVVGESTDAERAMQEAMLLSFRLDETSHVLNTEDYVPGTTEWDAALAGLTAEGEQIWFSWSHDGTLTEFYGKGRPEYMDYVLELAEFTPEGFTQTYFGNDPEGAEGLDGDPLTLCLPDMGIWLYFYQDSPWVKIYHADGEYWSRFYRENDPDRAVFDTVYAWLNAEARWAGVPEARPSTR